MRDALGFRQHRADDSPIGMATGAYGYERQRVHLQPFRKRQLIETGSACHRIIRNIHRASGALSSAEHRGRIPWVLERRWWRGQLISYLG